MHGRGRFVAASLVALAACGDEPTALLFEVEVDDTIRSVDVVARDERGAPVFPTTEVELPDGTTRGSVVIILPEDAPAVLNAWVRGLTSGRTAAATWTGRIQVTKHDTTHVSVELASPVSPAERPDAGCAPAPEIPGDGIDQDCDGADDCWRDSDRDGFGIDEVVTDDDLDCTNLSSPTAAVAGDCDDEDGAVRPGTTCDDGTNETRNDVCMSGACLGYRHRGCDRSCDACGAGDCCRPRCAGPDCPECPPGCSCNLECEDGDVCTGRCLGGSVCHWFVNGVDASTLTCEPGASCDLACNGADDCRLACLDGAYCIISYCNSARCTLDCATGAPMTCPGGVQVCHRACP